MAFPSRASLRQQSVGRGAMAQRYHAESD